jgi:hypothetical protein
MLIAIPFCAREVEKAKNLIQWMRELDGKMDHHHAVLVSAFPVPQDDLKAIVAIAMETFGRVDIVRQRTEDERGWPQSCNSMFRVAHGYISDIIKRPFWWNECDCVPVKPYWLSLLEEEYSRCGKPFMGFIVRNHPIGPHLTGCAIYPPNIADYNPYLLSAVDLAWDVMRPEYTLPHVHHTALLHHEWGDGPTNTAPSFPNRRSLGIISDEAAVFHRNKDHTLIDRLREQRRKPESPRILRFLNLR